MKTPSINRSYAAFFQVVVLVLGIGMLGLMLWEPHLEGRNAQATAFEIYFHDPFLAYVYVGSIPFFVALWWAFGLFGDVRRTGTFSLTTVKALRAIQRCAVVLLGFVAGGVVIILAFGDPDDRPAGFVMGMFVAGVASVVATVAAKLARGLEKRLKTVN